METQRNPDTEIAIQKKVYETSYGQVEMNFIIDEGIGIPRSENGETLADISHSDFIFIPGWSINPAHPMSVDMARTMTRYTDKKVISLDPKSETPSKKGSDAHAEAIITFLQDHGITKITAIGNSEGGSALMKAIILAKERYPELQVDGLVLLESMSLYEQSKKKLVTNYFRDVLAWPFSLFWRDQSSKRAATPLSFGTTSSQEHDRDGKATTASLKEMRTDIEKAGGIVSEIRDLLAQEVTVMKSRPEGIEKIDCPVVLVHGQDDKLTNITEALRQAQDGYTDVSSSTIQNYRLRQQLARSLFPNSPSVRLLLAQRYGRHLGLAVRPEEFVKAGLLGLRWSRQN